MKLCNFNNEDLHLWALGELGLAPAEEVARHVASCPECQEESAGVRTLLQEIEALPVPDPGELFFHQQLKQIESQLQEDKSRAKSFRRFWYPALAAAAVLLAFIGYTQWNRLSTPSWVGEWDSALSYLAEEAEPVLGWFEIEDLDDRELDLVAQGLEGQLLKDELDTWFDEPADLQELNDKEIEELLDELEAVDRRRHT